MIDGGGGPVESYRFAPTVPRAGWYSGAGL